jgi:hypothetical protein
MSVDWLFLIPVPPSMLSSDAYLDVEDFWKGDDYIIDTSGDRWDPRVPKSTKRRRALALALTRTHLFALRRLKPPREIIVTTDAAAPDGRGESYTEARAAWLAHGGFTLPDVVDEILASEQSAQAVPPLEPSDVRIPFPEGTRRARLRRLEPTHALQLLHGPGVVPPHKVRGVRAGVVLVDVDGGDLDALARHYQASLRALGMVPRVETPSKWIDEKFVQMRGKRGDLEVSVTARPDPRGGLDVGVLWIERVSPGVPVEMPEPAKTARQRARPPEPPSGSRRSKR